MDAITPSWSATLTEKLERQLLRVQVLAVDRVKKDGGCITAQQYAARTAVDALFNNASELMAGYQGAREGMKITSLINTIKLIHSDSKTNQQTSNNEYGNKKTN
jgi:hypothetical protein